MDGTASLANRDFDHVVRTKRRKVLFSGAACRANEAASAGYSAASGGESEETGLVGGAGWIRTPGAARASMGGIRPEFGALFNPNKSIRAGEILFARVSALLRISPVPFFARLMLRTQ